MCLQRSFNLHVQPPSLARRLWNRPHTCYMTPRLTRSRLFVSAQRRRLSTSDKLPGDRSSNVFYQSIYNSHSSNAELAEEADGSGTGSSNVTPKLLKQLLDEYVIGQDRAKRVLSTAVYNHYQRVRELERVQQEAATVQRRNEYVMRRIFFSSGGAHHDENSSPFANPGPDNSPKQKQPALSDADLHFEALASQFAPRGQRSSPNNESSHTESESMFDKNGGFPAPGEPRMKLLRGGRDSSAPLELGKSNVLIVGPSGVGKTLMVKTLAGMLDIPFTISDCTPLTSAGYIGEDAEVVVHRLLAAADYDVARAETGIICLDEFDKIATVKVAHGKDVGGEGVQQALLKIIEGTTVTIQAKGEKASNSNDPTRNPHSPPAAPKPEVFNVRTDNIMFICAGAFNGLHKHVMDRIAKGSIGFNAPIRASKSDAAIGAHDTTVELTSSNNDLFKEHLPYSLQPSANTTTAYAHAQDPLSTSFDSIISPSAGNSSAFTYSPTCVNSFPAKLNILDLVTPTDLHRFGLLPELIGRVPVHTAVSSLTAEALERVLTEPRNALLKQYTALFTLGNITLHFTRGAVRAVAKRAEGMTGARGLRSVLEAVLSESMFETPGSTVKYVLVTRDVVEKRSPVVHLNRGQGQLFERLVAEEAEKDESDATAAFNVEMEQGSESSSQSRSTVTT